VYAPAELGQSGRPHLAEALAQTLIADRAGHLRHGEAAAVQAALGRFDG